MNLNLTSLILDETTEIEREVPVQVEKLAYSFGTYPVIRKSPAKIRVSRSGDGILDIHGTCTLAVEIPCDRCLSPVEVPIDLEFDERVNSDGTDPDAIESDESQAFEEVSSSGKGRKKKSDILEDFYEDNARKISEEADGTAFEENYYLQGYNLDVDKLISGEALLNWPTRVLCREDCRGLCPVCGHNLNEGDCGCDRGQLDPRMAKVLDVFAASKKD